MIHGGDRQAKLQLLTMEVPEESRNENTKGLDVALSFTVARIFLSCAFSGNDAI